MGGKSVLDIPSKNISGGMVIVPAGGPVIPHVADANARLSLTAEGVVVSGAGTAAANGVWTQRGTDSGKPYYNRSDKPSGLNSWSIQWSGAWYIYGSEDGTPTLYYGLDDVARPDLVTTWVTFSGSEPFPTVTHQPGDVTGAGYRVIQDDGPTLYEFLGDGADADAGLWVSADDPTQVGPYSFNGTTYDLLSNPATQCVLDHGAWTFPSASPEAYVGTESVSYSWQTTTWTPGDIVVLRNPVASEANWNDNP